MDTKSLTNYELTTNQIDNYINDFVKEDTENINLNRCRLNLRIVDMINATIGNTDILKIDVTYYSTVMNHYSALVKHRMYKIISERIQDNLDQPTTND